MERISASKLTQEQKAVFQQSRILSDVKLIQNGAGYAPGQDGEPVLNVNLNNDKTSMIVKRESPEAVRMIKLIERLRPIYSGFNWPRLVKGMPKFEEMFSRGTENEEDTAGKTIYESPKKQISISKLDDDTGREYHVNRKSFSRTSVFFRNSEERLPCIIIKRSIIEESLYFSMTEEYMTKLTECYSIEEFYTNLTSEEKKGGKALGLKRYLSKR